VVECVVEVVVHASGFGWYDLVVEKRAWLGVDIWDDGDGVDQRGRVVRRLSVRVGVAGLDCGWVRPSLCVVIKRRVGVFEVRFICTVLLINQLCLCLGN
jgi:hypothetical protein